MTHDLRVPNDAAGPDRPFQVVIAQSLQGCVASPGSVRAPPLNASWARGSLMLRFRALLEVRDWTIGH